MYSTVQYLATNVTVTRDNSFEKIVYQFFKTYTNEIFITSIFTALGSLESV